MITLNGHTLSLKDVWQVASQKSPCALAAEARPLIRRSRELVESLAAQPRAIYGINTGFGPLSGFRITARELGQHQLNLLHHLSVGQGPLFSVVETRAIMAARANALARGYSGLREELIELLLAALNRGLLPEIPTEGSLGASGDLVPLAHMTNLLVGLGHARLDGERLPAMDALRKAGLKPAVLQCKEGLAMVNGTSVMTGLAALAAHEAERLLHWMELLTACLFQALGASRRCCANKRKKRVVFAANPRWPGASAITCGRIRILRGESRSINGALNRRQLIPERRFRILIRCDVPHRFWARFKKRCGTSNRWSRAN